uniref:C-type lectin domain-containing protein n=1 Tax=Scleropages formosus TaxID=113540 RepID=A0A8C9QU73_SCLFO
MTHCSNKLLRSLTNTARNVAHVYGMNRSTVGIEQKFVGRHFYFYNFKLDSMRFEDAVEKITSHLSSDPPEEMCTHCPPPWSCYETRCYYFSAGREGARTWNESAQFCMQWDASLAVIDDLREMVSAVAVSERLCLLDGCLFLRNQEK